MSDTLTMDVMLDAIRRVKAMGPPPPREIIVSDLLPRKVLAEYPITHVRLAHPLIVWLSKWLPMSPWVWLEGIEQETEDAAYVIGDKMYVSSRVYAALRARA